MITLDLETRSYANLPQVGSWVYSEHPTTEILCACYAIDDEPIREWWPEVDGIAGCPPPEDLFEALDEGHAIEAWNVSFERSLWENVLGPRHDWPLPRDEQWRDTMAVAAYYSLPQALDKCCRALGMEGKDPEGGRLISRYSKLYLKTSRAEIPEEDHQKFVDYCKRDVLLEETVSDFLGDLPEQELAVFLLDQRINLRGLYLDAGSIGDSIAVVKQRAGELEREFREITGLGPLQHAKVSAWLRERGCPVESLQGDYIEELLAGLHDFTPEGEAYRALELRRQYNKASTKKLVAMLRNRARDGRARYQTRYHGANSGRATGTGFQPLNLKRSMEDVPPEQLVRDISHRSPAFLDCMYGDAMDAVAKAVRHHICAEPRRQIYAGDYTSIEAVILACLAEEDWKIEAFRHKEPIYELMAYEMFGLGEEALILARADKSAFKDKFPKQRQAGKQGELAFGYGGALGAWRTQDPKASSDHSDEEVIAYCRAWREKHPRIVSFWYDLEHAAARCVTTGRDTEVGPIEFRMVENWLSIRLLSSKRLWLWDPQMRISMPHWHDPDTKVECATGECDCVPRPQLTYMSMKEGQWRRISGYGGRLCGLVTQAHAREVLMPALLRIDRSGYHVILSVYDEAVSEVPVGFGSVGEYRELMLEPEPWWAEWPIDADVWTGDRYRK